MDIGVFIPIGNNGWLISNTSPQYKPSYDFNLEIVKKAEDYGFEFALSMIKFRGFGGDSEFWDYNLESFTLMAGLAAATDRIKLYASAAVLALPPAVAARMATTVDSISHGRFGVNLVSGWAKDEYAQMGIWPGDVHFERRYRYSEEYVRVMQDLWTTGVSDFKGEFFTMEDCKMLPMPEKHIPVVSAGQSAVGIEFAAKYADYNFVMGLGVNTPTAHASGVTALAVAAEKTGRDVGAYVLFMIISAETDAEAQALWKNYNDGIDLTAIGWMIGQAASDTGDETSTAKTIAAPEGAVNLNMGTLVGSYETVARLLDEAAEVHGTKGIMLVFDDFIKGLDDYGTKIQPLMTSRADVVAELSVS